MNPNFTRPLAGRNIAVAVLAIVLVLTGLVLGIGGAYLASLGGSIYYLVAGIALIVSMAVPLRCASK
eukprot:gene48998-66521_t